MGTLQRSVGEATSRVRVKVIQSASRSTPYGAIRDTVMPSSTLYTDAWQAYRGLAGYSHGVVDHAVEYVSGRVHTNGIENFWSLLKRGIKVTYVSVEPCHPSLYLGEQVFRFNERKCNDHDRFQKALGSAFDRRLTYRELINNGQCYAA